MRNNQAVLEQQGYPNAPNPRESNPPCYADAILMPRLKNSFTTSKLSSLKVNEIKRATKRTRSEEILHANVPNQRPILTAHSRKNLFQKWMTNTGDSSTALIKNESKIEIMSSQKSFEIIAQLETEDGHSPYAKRKPIITNEEFAKNTNQIIDSSDESLNNQDSACGGVDMPIYQNINSIYRDHYNELPHTSTQTFFTSKIPSTSSISSLSSFSSSTSVDSNDYVRLPQRTTIHSPKYSDI